MIFDQMEVGRWYWFRPLHGPYAGTFIVGRCCKSERDGSKMMVARTGSEEFFFTQHASQVTDIRPVWTPEELERLVMIQEKARAVMEWYDRDGSVGGAIDPMDQLRAALAAVGEG